MAEIENRVAEAEIALSLLKSDIEAICLLGYRIIDVCRVESPSQSAKKVQELIENCGFHQKIGNIISRSARHLAMIRRDFGMSKFNEIANNPNLRHSSVERGQ